MGLFTSHSTFCITHIDYSMCISILLHVHSPSRSAVLAWPLLSVLGLRASLVFKSCDFFAPHIRTYFRIRPSSHKDRQYSRIITDAHRSPKQRCLMGIRRSNHLRSNRLVEREEHFCCHNGFWSQSIYSIVNLDFLRFAGDTVLIVRYDCPRDILESIPHLLERVTHAISKTVFWKAFFTSFLQE